MVITRTTPLLYISPKACVKVTIEATYRLENHWTSRGTKLACRSAGITLRRSLVRQALLLAPPDRDCAETLLGFVVAPDDGQQVVEIGQWRTPRLAGAPDDNRLAGAVEGLRES